MVIGYIDLSRSNVMVMNTNPPQERSMTKDLWWRWWMSFIRWKVHV